MTDFHKNALERLFAFVIHHPVKTVLLSLLICAPFFWGLGNFKINPSPREFMGEDSALMKELTALEEEYVDDMNILLMIKPRSGDIFTNETLSAIHKITQAAWRLPSVSRVDSITNFQHLSADGDDLVVADLVEAPGELSADELSRVRDIALAEPRLVDLFVSKNGHATSINMLSNVDLTDPAYLQSVIAGLDDIVDEVAREHPDIEVYQSGYVVMTNHWTIAAGLDMQRVFVALFLIVIVGLVYFFRGVRAMAAVMLTASLSVVTGLGFLGLLGLQLNPASMLATLMVLVLGLADGIHIGKSARRLLAEGKDYQDALIEAVSSNFTPVALTSITTAIGFLSFNFGVDYEGVRIMGNYVAFGVMMAFVLSVTLLPALLCWCNLQPEKPGQTEPLHTRLADLVVRYRNGLLVIYVPLLVIGTACIGLNHIGEQITRYLRDDYIFTVHLDAVQEQLTGATTMVYNFHSASPDGVSDPEFLKKVEKFADYAKTIPEVRHVGSFTDTMKQLNKSMHGDDHDYYRLPSDRESAAQYILLYELSLPYGLDLTNAINMEKSGTRVVLTTNDMSSPRALEVVAEVETWLTRNIPEFNPAANSNTLTPLFSIAPVVEAMVINGITALLIIGTMLLFTFRSFYAGLICVITLLSPILVTYGIWGVFRGEIGLAGSLTICMVIGISVDFSVHFVSKFVYALRQLGCSVEDAVRYAYKLVTAPIVTSTVILGGGFAMLSFSIFQFNIVMGQITSLCIFLAALSALLLLPSVLLSNWYSKRLV